eukprot:1311839-Prymnesium_polylepis.1
MECDVPLIFARSECFGVRVKARGSLLLEASGLVKALQKNSSHQNVMQKADSLKRSLGLGPVTNKASAVFVCCSRSDALNHARVLRSELS